MSVIKFYQCDITKDRNCVIEQIETYLADKQVQTEQGYLEFLDLQYIKISMLTAIDLPFKQSELMKNEFNYLSIEQDSKKYYFFVDSKTWLSQSATRVYCTLDVLNTFQGEYELSEKCNVIRQHKNRFKNTDRMNLDPLGASVHFVLDNVDEGINPSKVKVESNTIEDSESKARINWYLVYQTLINNVNSSPIDVYLMPKTQVPYATSYSASLTWTPEMLNPGSWYWFMKSDNPTQSESFALHLYGNSIEYLRITIDNEDSVSTTIVSPLHSSWTFNSESVYYETNSSNVSVGFIFSREKQYVKAGSTGVAYLEDISVIDRSNPNIVKIIELPYCPDEISWSGNTINLTNSAFERVGRRLRLKDYTSEFGRIIKNIPLANYTIATYNASSKADFVTKTKNAKYEPKLFHSSFFTYKINYDSFNSGIDFEKIIDLNNNQTYDLEFKPSNNLSSELGFKWILKQGASYESDEDYANVLISNRNNEIGLFNSDYLNYLRNGYNYDKKAKNRQELLAVGSIALNTASFMATGNAVNLLSITNGINQILSSEETFNRKLEEYKQHSASVTNAGAIDLLNWYNGNKARIITYSCTNEMKESLFKLFYYCGYARNKIETIDTNSRYWFNFVQANVVFDKYENICYNYLEEIKKRFEEGVTFYHCRDNEYDLDQKYENWEMTLFN